MNEMLDKVLKMSVVNKLDYLVEAMINLKTQVGTLSQAQLDKLNNDLTTLENSLFNKIVDIEGKLKSQDFNLTSKSFVINPQDIDPLSKVAQLRDALFDINSHLIISPEPDTGTENNGKIIAETGFRPLKQTVNGELSFTVDNTPTLPVKIVITKAKKGVA